MRGREGNKRYNGKKNEGEEKERAQTIRENERGSKGGREEERER